ncbi:MAG: tol-pal system protein YbgF [Gemmatimonadetes bacterium]|nr:tol-pal system protein YbgF [Gemmatimonadota bacterium]
MRMRPAAARAFLTLAAAASLGGCATKGDLRNLRLEIRSLAARQDSLFSELRRDTRSAQDTLRETSLQLFDFRGDIARQLAAINESLTRLEALTGENQRGISGVRDQMANLRRAAGSQPAAEGAPPGGVQEAGGAGSDAESIYNAAVAQFNRGSLATARSAFQQFLQAFPSHRLAPDAHFYLADILVQEDRLEDALDAFQEIPELFPTASKVPDAMYRSALLQIELGQGDAARATLARVINTYPGSGVATLARDKLREIR